MTEFKLGALALVGRAVVLLEESDTDRDVNKGIVNSEDEAQVVGEELAEVAGDVPLGELLIAVELLDIELLLDIQLLMAVEMLAVVGSVRIGTLDVNEPAVIDGDVAGVLIIPRGGDGLGFIGAKTRSAPQ